MAATGLIMDERVLPRDYTTERLVST